MGPTGFSLGEDTPERGRAGPGEPSAGRRRSLLLRCKGGADKPWARRRLQRKSVRVHAARGGDS